MLRAYSLAAAIGCGDVVRRDRELEELRKLPSALEDTGAEAAIAAALALAEGKTLSPGTPSALDPFIRMAQMLATPLRPTADTST
jgi:hypothetical protein